MSIYARAKAPCNALHVLTVIFASFELQAQANGSPVYRVRYNADLTGENRRRQFVRNNARGVDVPIEKLVNKKKNKKLLLIFKYFEIFLAFIFYILF